MNSKFIFIGLFCALYCYAAQGRSMPVSERLVGSTSFAPNSSSLYFIENVGQIKDQYDNARPDLDFKITSGGLSMFIGKGKIQYQWIKALGQGENPVAKHLGMEPKEPVSMEAYRMDVFLLGANRAAEKVMEEQNNYYENYFNINGALAGARAHTYRKITYKDIYPRIDWVLYVKGNQVEYDFIVHPGGRVQDIRMRYDGATSLQINPDGSLTAQTPMGSVTERAPYSFQPDGTVIASRFQLKGNELSFDVGAYQHALTIDPVLDWSSYYGGDGAGIQYIDKTTTDQVGNVYFSGNTASTVNMATVGAYQSTFLTGSGPSGLNGWFAKFNQSGERQWATYYATNKIANAGISVAFDTLGYLYISGTTDSSYKMSTPGAHQTSFGGGAHDLYLAKFDTLGNRIWCTYLGGTKDDYAIEDYRGLVCDGKYVFMGGMTKSESGIATVGAHQSIHNAGVSGGSRGTADALLAKFNDDGVLQWATYYGGDKAETGTSLALDKKGDVYIAGYTGSVMNIATPGSFKPSTSNSDGFLAKFNSDGIRQWGTYFGGEGADHLFKVNCDQELNVYISGHTGSATGIATPGSYQDRRNGASDAFLAKFNANGMLQWGTYYGGEEMEYCFGMIIDTWNRIYITGATESISGIADSNALQPVYAGKTGSFPYGDGFLAEFTKEGTRKSSTYWGRSGSDWPCDVAVDNKGSLYICGGTTSWDLATPGSHMDTFPVLNIMTIYQGFMARFCVDLPDASISLEGPDTICAFKTVNYTAGDLIDVEEYHWELPSGWEGTGTDKSINVTIGKESGVVKLRVKRCGQLSDWVAYPVYVFPPDPAVITVDSFTLGTAGIYASYQWLFNGALIPGATERNYTVNQNGDYSVVTVTQDGCLDTSKVYAVRNVSVKDITMSNHIRIYPNPASGRQLQVAAPIPVSIGIYSIDGRLLQYKTKAKLIDIEGLSPGIHLIRVSDLEGNLLKTEKLIRW